MTATVVTGNGRGNGRGDVPETLIAVPDRTVEKIRAHIVSTAPLIVHRLGETAIGKIQVDQGPGAKPKREPRNPQRDFEEALYKLGPDQDGKERYGFPAGGMKKAMVVAAQRHAGEKRTELNGMFTIPGQYLVIDSPNPPRMRTDRVLYQGKTLDLAYRPEFDPWEMAFTIIVVTSLITIDKVLYYLNLAGTTVGIGNWRVDKQGTFGTWEIVDAAILGG